jgi:hypothetical protein
VWSNRSLFEILLAYTRNPKTENNASGQKRGPRAHCPKNCRSSRRRRSMGNKRNEMWTAAVREKG